MSNNKRLECIVSGRVQMVMFRDFVQRKARELELVGTVQNMVDGTVHIVAEGSEESLLKLLSEVCHGPILAKVEEVKEKWSDASGKFKDFKIVYKNLLDRI